MYLEKIHEAHTHEPDSGLLCPSPAGPCSSSNTPGTLLPQAFVPLLPPPGIRPQHNWFPHFTSAQTSFSMFYPSYPCLCYNTPPRTLPALPHSLPYMLLPKKLHTYLCYLRLWFCLPLPSPPCTLRQGFLFCSPTCLVPRAQRGPLQVINKHLVSKWSDCKARVLNDHTVGPPRWDLNTLVPPRLL